MKRYKPVGWRHESQRHSLAARGISSNYYSTKGKYFAKPKLKDKYVVNYFEIDNTERPLMDGLKIKLYDTEEEAKAKADELTGANIPAQVDKVRENEDGSIEGVS